MDDVLFTGRTIRAALDALIDFSRAAKIELVILSIGDIVNCLFAPIMLVEYPTSRQNRCKIENNMKYDGCYQEWFNKERLRTFSFVI